MTPAAGAWRILVGADAVKLDEFVRADPDSTDDREARIAYLEG